MPKARWSFHVAAIFACVAIGTGAYGEELSFNFALVSRGPAGAPQVLDYRVDRKTGPELQFKFLIAPAKGSVYLVLIDAQGDITLLYPKFDGKGLSKPDANDVPKGNAWFSVDATPGIEKFELVAAVPRPVKFEEALLRWCKARAQSEAAAAGEPKERLLNELAALKRSAGRFAEAPGKPTSFGGSVRGADLSSIPVSTITAEGVFARTIRIEH